MRGRDIGKVLKRSGMDSKLIFAKVVNGLGWLGFLRDKQRASAGASGKCVEPGGRNYCGAVP